MNDLGLQNALGARIQYLGRAQAIVAQNIANADTPGYRPMQLTPVDFGALLGRNLGSSIHIGSTNAAHIVSSGGAKAGESKERRQKLTYEVAPSGNAVILEEQLMEANKIRQDYAMVTNLYQKNIQLLKTAIGTAR